MAKTLEEAIAEKRAEMDRIRGELDVLERAQALLSDQPARATRPVVAIAVRQPATYSAPTSSVEHALAVLREANGVALHVDEIIKRAHARGVSIRKTTLVSNLARLNKLDNPQIKRVGPNTFTLGDAERREAVAS